MNFNTSDVVQLEKYGINPSDIEKQLKQFRNGFPPLKLVAPARINDGIIVFNEEEIKSLVNEYDEFIKKNKIIKFVPASGAATRMFKTLELFRSKNLSLAEQNDELYKDRGFQSPYNFFSNLSAFAFYNHLNTIIEKSGNEPDHLDLNEVIDYLLYEKGLNYARLPKALILFHKYKDFDRTSLEEHLAESAMYATSSDRISRIHFTISPEHLSIYKEHLNNILPHCENLYSTKFEIGFSFQDAATSTIAVDINNEFFRDKDNNLLLRPGGHGALISNLNHLDADLIFIKNIDNVVPDSLKEETIIYKKVLGGCLIGIKKKIDYYIDQLQNEFISNDQLSEIEKFITERLFYRTEAHKDNSKKIKIFKRILNRPLRVCGMVKIQDEPGGGPFWVKNKDGSASLHIVEASQINTSDHEQAKILNESTHFNPVDLVCSIRNSKGETYHLHNYVDPDTGFISIKSKDGRSLKALELPGLWNGGMSDWNTIFVEVPLKTFNPVKTINDLLRKEHRT